MNHEPRIHVTQVASAMVFILMLWILAKGYSPGKNGIGYVTGEYISELAERCIITENGSKEGTIALFKWIFLGACVLLNCLRYYFNVWTIEVTESLLDVINGTYRVVDEVLRFISLFFIYFVLLHLQEDPKHIPLSVEWCMIFVFTCFLAWDFMAIRELNRSQDNDSNEIQKQLRKVKIWRQCDFCCWFSSVIWILISGFLVSDQTLIQNPLLLGILIILPGVLFLIVFFYDFKKNYRDYKDLLLKNKFVAVCGFLGLIVLGCTIARP